MNISSAFIIHSLVLSCGSFFRLRITQGEVYVSYDETSSLGSLTLIPCGDQDCLILPLAPISRDSTLDPMSKSTTLKLLYPTMSESRVVVEYNTSTGKPLSVQATTAKCQVLKKLNRFLRLFNINSVYLTGTPYTGHKV